MHTHIAKCVRFCPVNYAPFRKLHTGRWIFTLVAHSQPASQPGDNGDSSLSHLRIRIAEQQTHLRNRFGITRQRFSRPRYGRNLSTKYRAPSHLEQMAQFPALLNRSADLPRSGVTASGVKIWSERSARRNHLIAASSLQDDSSEPGDTALQTRSGHTNLGPSHDSAISGIAQHAASPQKDRAGDRREQRMAPVAEHTCSQWQTQAADPCRPQA